MVWLLKRNNGVLERVSCQNIKEDDWKGRNLGVPLLPKAVVETKAPVLVRNVQTDPRVLDPEFFRKHERASYLGVPLIANGEVLDVLSLCTKCEQPFSDEEVHLGLWEEAHAPPDRGPPEKEITFGPSYGSINSPSRGRSRDSQLM